MSVLIFDTRKSGGVLFVSESDVSTPTGDIDTITTGGVSGLKVGSGFAIETAGLGTLTNIEIKSASTPAAKVNAISLSAFAGDGNAIIPKPVVGGYYPFLGAVTVTATDGALTASSSFTLGWTNYLDTTFAGIITSDATYLGKALSDAGHPIVDGERAYYADENSLAIGANSSISIAASESAELVIYIHKLSGIIEGYKLTISESGDIIPDGTIDSLASLIYQGVSTPFQTTGIDSPITSITFGDVAMAFAESGGDGSLTAPAWYSGLIQPLDHEQDYSVYITDGVTSASALRQYGVPAGLEHRTVPGTVNTGNDSLYQYSTFQPGFDAYIPDLGAGSIDNDGTFVDLVPGTYPGFWSRDLSYEMHQFTLVYAPTTPAVFKFIDVNNATASTTYTSNTVTISALVESVPVTIVGGTYSKNGGPFITAEGTADNGDEFRVRLVTGTNPSDSFNSTLTVGTRSDTYTVNMPDANTGGGQFGVTSRSITAR